MINRGFTILETIVALGVISLTIAGVFTAVRTGITASINAKDEIRAFYLAQEAIELLRRVRDSNKLTSINTGTAVPWLISISDPCVFSTCRADATGPGGDFFFDCGSISWNVCPFLRQDTATYIYAYMPWAPLTKYKREIRIEKPVPDEAIVTISIRWSRGTINHELKVKTLMLNWR